LWLTINAPVEDFPSRFATKVPIRYLLFGGIFVYNSKKEVDQMRWLSRLLVIFVICLVAVTLPAAPAQAVDGGAYITLSPDDGVPGEEVGEEVKVYGYNFTAGEWVDIYYDLNGDEEWADEEWVDDVKADGNGDFRVTLIVPESYTGKHKVFAEDEDEITAYADFTVEPGLTVSPEEGPVGTNATVVTVKGYGFAEDEEEIEVRYYLNGDDETVKENITADEDGSWETSFPIPGSAKGSHKIDAEGEDSSLGEVQDTTFEVIPGISLDESSGSPSESITMTGNGFAANDRYIKILFGGEEAETQPEIIRADENGYWEASFKVPEMPTDTYSITAEGEWTEDVNELNFEIKPGLVLSPDEGHVGTDLTVTGHGFAAYEDVDIMYDGSQVTTDRTNAEGSFDVSFPVPESEHGQRLVTAEDDLGNNATAKFTMESDLPDTPELISPPDGGRVGLIGSVRPTFEWSEVSDDSGVYYSLQIATSENVTTTGEFIGDPIFSVEGLVGTNYTLNATEALPYGTYYWIVQAVDGAENGSGWTAARSFRAGLLPLGAFIVIIVAIAAGIGAAIYFFVIRRRIYYY
jgi:hypothetical protein